MTTTEQKLITAEELLPLSRGEGKRNQASQQLQPLDGSLGPDVAVLRFAIGNSP